MVLLALVAGEGRGLEWCPSGPATSIRGYGGGGRDVRVYKVAQHRCVHHLIFRAALGVVRAGGRRRNQRCRVRTAPGKHGFHCGGRREAAANRRALAHGGPRL